MDHAALRKSFKAICKATNDRHQNYQIRVHRSLSWYARALELDAEKQSDGRLIYGWIAFNALYGVWDEDVGFPARDGESWRDFLGWVLRLDREAALAAALKQLRPDVMWVLENKFLDPRFWREPAARPPRGLHFDARTQYLDGRWGVLLENVFARIYLLRSQVIHGAATSGGSLNRDTLRKCGTILEGLLPPILKICIETGAHDDWPPLCYAPVKEGAAARKHEPGKLE